MLPWPRERVSRHVRQAPRLAALGALVVLGALVIFDLLLAWALVRPSEKSRAISPLPSIALHAFHRADRVLSPASTSATGQAQRLLVRPPSTSSSSWKKTTRTMRLLGRLKPHILIPWRVRAP